MCFIPAVNSSRVIEREGNVTLASLLTRHRLCAEAAPDPANGEEAADVGTSPSTLFFFFALFLITPLSGPMRTMRVPYGGGGGERGRARTQAGGGRSS